MFNPDHNYEHLAAGRQPRHPDYAEQIRDGAILQRRLDAMSIGRWDTELYSSVLAHDAYRVMYENSDIVWC